MQNFANLVAGRSMAAMLAVGNYDRRIYKIEITQDSLVLQTGLLRWKVEQLKASTQGLILDSTILVTAMADSGFHAKAV